MRHLVDTCVGEPPEIRGDCSIFSAIAAIAGGLATAGAAVGSAGAAIGAPLAAGLTSGLGALGVGAGTAAGIGGAIGTGAGVGLMTSGAGAIANHINEFAHGKNPFRNPGKAILGDLAKIGTGVVTGGLTGGLGATPAAGNIIGEAAKGAITGAASSAGTSAANAAMEGGPVGRAALRGAVTGGAGGLAGAATGAIPSPYESTAPAPMTDMSGASEMGSQYVPNTTGQMMANSAMRGMRPLASHFASGGANMLMTPKPPQPMSPYSRTTPWWAK